MIARKLGEGHSDPDARLEFLRENADGVVRMRYLRKWDAERIREGNATVSALCHNIDSMEAKLRAMTERYENELDSLRRRRSELVENLTRGGVWVDGECFMMVRRTDDGRSGVASFYDKDGVLVEEREATREELAPTVFSELRKGMGWCPGVPDCPEGTGRDWKGLEGSERV